MDYYKRVEVYLVHLYMVTNEFLRYKKKKNRVTYFKIRLHILPDSEEFFYQPQTPYLSIYLDDIIHWIIYNHSSTVYNKLYFKFNKQ